MTIKHQSVIDAFITRLQTITVVNGYSSDIGNNVSDWNLSKSIIDELPRVTVRDNDEITVTREIVGQFLWEMPIEIHIELKGETALADSRKIIDDVFQAIGTDITFGGLVDILEPGSFYMVGAQDEKKVFEIFFRFTATFQTTEWSST